MFGASPNPPFDSNGKGDAVVVVVAAVVGAPNVKRPCEVACVAVVVGVAAAPPPAPPN